jgi:hypothetical protein
MKQSKNILLEEIIGAQALVYHGSRLPPEVFIKMYTENLFKPGSGAGAAYGEGLYTVYDLDGTPTSLGSYGEYIYKFKVNLYGFISLNPEITEKIYKEKLLPSEQGIKLGLDNKVIKILQKFDKNTSYTARTNLGKALKNTCRGLIYSGSGDGDCAVIYDHNSASLLGYKKINENIWTPIDENTIKQQLNKPTSLDRERKIKYSIPTYKHLQGRKKHTINQHVELANYQFPILDDTVIKGSLDLTGSEYVKLPKNLMIIGDLICKSCELTKLPTGLVVMGDLDMEDSSMSMNSLRKLPKGLVVRGHLNLRNSSIRVLPDEMTAGMLSIDETGIESLPRKLSVGILNVDDGQINSIPDDTVIYNNIDGDNNLVKMYNEMSKNKISESLSSLKELIKEVLHLV